MRTEVQLRSVRLLGAPVGLWCRSRDWFEGLLREFDIIATGSDGATPRSLVDFVADVRGRFSRFSTGSTSLLEKAVEQGEVTVDLEMKLPPEAAAAARDLWVRILAADDFCRQGDLLTVALPEDVRAFIRWYLDEVADQTEGGEPRPWSSRQPWNSGQRPRAG